MGFMGGIDYKTSQAIHELRDISKESKKQSNYMFWISIAILALTVTQIIILVIN